MSVPVDIKTEEVILETTEYNSAEELDEELQLQLEDSGGEYIQYQAEPEVSHGQRHSNSSMHKSGGGGGTTANSNGGKNLLDSEKRMRREIANSNERRRMQSINAGFQNLRALLPQSEGDKLSKVTSDESSTSMSITKQQSIEIRENIIKGTYTIKLEPGRSKIWEVFGKVENGGHLIKDFVACKNCSSVFKFTSSTSNLVKHKCYKNLKNRSDELKLQVDHDTEEDIADTFTEWVTTNCRPLQMVQDTGLKKYTEKLLEIGAKYGSNVDVDRLLPQPTTISRNIDDLYNTAYEALKSELKELGSFGLTTDLWKDDYLQQSYLALTIHFIKAGRIIMKLVAFRSMDYEACSGEQIMQTVTSALNEFDVRLNSAIIVTDRGANMEAAFRAHNHIFCISHMLHNIVERSIAECLDINEICNKCIKLVTYFKKTGADAQLNTSLESFSVTKWNTIFYLLQSVQQNWTDIKTILWEKNQTHRISNISLNTLTELVNVLENFEKSCKELEADKCPTLNLVIVHAYFLKRKCETNSSNELECIKSFKLQLSTLINDVLIKNLTIFHKIALFLFPPTNKLLQFTSEEKMEIKLYCKNMLESMITTEQYESKYEISSPNPLSNNKEQLFSGFLLQPTNSANNFDQVQNEILLYENVNEVMHDEFDVLHWWELNKLKFPLLFKLSLKILAAPASSAAAERIFSNAKNLLCEKPCIIGSNPNAVGKAAILQQTSQYICELETQKTQLLNQNSQLKRQLSLHESNASANSGDNSAGDDPLSTGNGKKRKLTDNVINMQTISDSSDEGLGSMSPEPATLLNAANTKNQALIAHNAATNKELNECRKQLDKERRMRTMLEEELQMIKRQLYSVATAPPASSTTSSYIPREVIEHTDNLVRETIDELPAGTVSYVEIDEVTGQRQVVVCSSIEELESEAAAAAADIISEDNNMQEEVILSSTSSTESEHEVNAIAKAYADGTSPSAAVLQPILQAAIKATPKVEVERIQEIIKVKTEKIDQPSGLTRSRQNLETIVEAIRHLEGDHLFAEGSEKGGQRVHQEAPLALTTKVQHASRATLAELRPYLQLKSGTKQVTIVQQSSPTQQQSKDGGGSSSSSGGGTTATVMPTAIYKVQTTAAAGAGTSGRSAQGAQQVTITTTALKQVRPGVIVAKQLS